MFVHYIETPIGKIGIVEKQEKIIEVFFANHGQKEESEEKETALLSKASQQLIEYFDGKRKAFDLPLAPEGTEFQKCVWSELEKIPYGETRTYGQIASQIGNPNASRAVGGANHNNPISIIVPCHRVIGADGSLTGYGGGIDIKKELLELEKKYVSLK